MTRTTCLPGNPDTVLYQSGIVAEVRGQSARVEFIHSGTCGGCSGNQGCGLGPILAMFRGARPHSMELDIAETGLELKVGDTVRIAMAGRQLLKIVSLVYLLPLLGMFSGAWLAATVIPDASDLTAVVGAFGGLLCVSGVLALTWHRQAGRSLCSARLHSRTPVQSGAD